MAKFIIRYQFTNEIEIEARDKVLAIMKSKELALEALQYTGDYELLDIEEVEN